MKQWKFIDTGYNDGVYNMAFDEMLLNEFKSSNHMGIFRLYEWNPPAISIGRFQDASKVLNLQLCNEENIQVVQRITGGGAIFHNEELTYSIVCSTDAINPCSVKDSYEKLCNFLILTYRELGLDAYFANETDMGISPAKTDVNVIQLSLRGSERNERQSNLNKIATSPTDSRNGSKVKSLPPLIPLHPPLIKGGWEDFKGGNKGGFIDKTLGKKTDFCFAGIEAYDILIKGKKIGGNAQKRKRNIIFQHGSIPINLNTESIKKYFKNPLNDIEQNIVSLNSVSNINTNELKEIIKRNFEKNLGVELL